MKMNPEVKTKWLELLRSGKYEQGESCLCQTTEYSKKDHEEIEFKKPRYCCLGILCLVEGSPEVPTNNEFPENKTLEWAGLTRNDKISDSILDETNTAEHLAYLNDHNKTFETIAQVIEEKL